LLPDNLPLDQDDPGAYKWNLPLYADPMPRMPVAQPVDPSLLNPPIDPSRHQRYSEFVPVKHYIQVIRPSNHQYHSALPAATVIWGFNGQCPGETFHARYGEPVLIRRYNQLPPDWSGFALPSFTTHLHNLHHASESDGLPWDHVDPGYFWDYHHPNYPAGGDPREKQTTQWYHDHRMDFTAANVYMGLTGFYLLFDEKDSGDENDPNHEAFRLPSGDYDVPMILHDISLDSQAQIYLTQNTNGFLGNLYTVNRKITPYLEVEPRKYRFRFLNGGPSRFYELRLRSGQKFTVIGNDGNLLPEPVMADTIKLSVAQRHDVIVDFSQFQPGATIELENIMEQIRGEGPTGRSFPKGQGDPIMQFRVVAPTGPDNSRVPKKLRALPEISEHDVRKAKQRLFLFDYHGGNWTVNRQTFDMDRVDAFIEQGQPEIWTIRNGGTNWEHPVHIHFEEFQILEFNGKPLAKNDVNRSRKDVLTLGPGDEVKLFFQFRDYLGDHVMHCHNVVHEDHQMMIRWRIVPPKHGPALGSVISPRPVMRLGNPPVGF
jgi:FtsP/CotA-like multicopper oxidase with cupredoxin domain